MPAAKMCMSAISGQPPVHMTATAPWTDRSCNRWLRPGCAVITAVQQYQPHRCTRPTAGLRASQAQKQQPLHHRRPAKVQAVRAVAKSSLRRLQCLLSNPWVDSSKQPMGASQLQQSGHPTSKVTPHGPIHGATKQSVCGPQPTMNQSLSVNPHSRLGSPQQHGRSYCADSTAGR